MKINKMKYILLVTLALSLLLAMIPASLVSADGPVISISAPASVGEGGGFYALINVTGANHLNGTNFDLSYDPTKIQVRGVVNVLGSGVSDGLVGGNVMPVSGWNFLPSPPGTPSGTIRVTNHLNNFGEVNGDGYLAKILFDVVGVGSSSLTLANTYNLVQYLPPIFADPVAAKTFPTIGPSQSVTTVATIVTTNNATNIGDNSATLNGMLQTTPPSAATLAFGYSTSHGGPYTMVNAVPPTTTTSPTSFSANITGLTSATRYYFTAISTVGTNPPAFGAELNFLTTGGPQIPTVNSLDPNTGAPGALPFPVTVHGTNLAANTTLSFSGTGVNASNLAWVNSTQMTATITIDGNAALGQRNVTVTTPLVGSGTLNNGFTVVSANQTTFVNLQAPTIVPAGGGFLLNVNITNAVKLKIYSFDVVYNPAVIQINGIEYNITPSSGITSGNITGVEFPNDGWTFQPTPGVPSGDIHVSGFHLGTSVSGSGYLCKINFKVVGGVGLSSNIALSGLTLTDEDENIISPATSAISVLVGGSIVTTDPATAITATSATLNGNLDRLVPADNSAALSFGYARVHGGPYTNITGTPASSNNPPTPFSANLTGLNPGITYFFVAQSQSTNGFVTGNESSFTTLFGPTPTITPPIQPNTGRQGQTLAGVIINGTHLLNTTSASFGAKITVTIKTTTDSVVTADLVIADDAVLGSRDVTVTTSDGGPSAALTGGFTVTQGLPAISSVVPNVGKQGDTLTGVIISGLRLTAATSVTFGAGITVTKTANTDTQITVNLLIDANADPGLRDVSVTNSFGTGTKSPGFIVASSQPPTITFLSPNAGVQGAFNLLVMVNGTNLAGASVVSFNGTGVTAGNIVTISNTQITTMVTIASNADVGFRNVTVTTPAGSFTKPSGFRVASLSAPVINSITPSSGTQGANVSVTIVGSQLTGSNAVTFYLSGAADTKVVASNIAVVNDTQITATIAITSDAATGFRDVTATNSNPAIGEGAPLVNGFSVASSGGGGGGGFGGGSNLPTVTSVSPSTGQQGATLTGVIITGTNISSASAVTFSGTGVTAASFVSNSTTQITATVAITANAAVGARDVTVTTSAGTSSPLVGGFTVTAAPAVVTPATPPSITTNSPLPGGEVGVAYSVTFSATGGVLPYSWAVQTGILPSGLSLSTAGILSGTPTAAAASTTVTIKVTDNAGTTATKDFTIAIIGAPIITSSSLANGEVGVAYSQTLAASGGSSPYTFSVQTGTLPAGLSFSSAGAISGTPTEPASSVSVTFKVTDSRGGSGSKSLTITIVSGPAITTSSLPNGEVGIAYTQNLAGSGGTSPYTLSVQSGTLPSGLSLSSAGVISGTPSAAVSSAAVTFKIADSLGGNSTKVLTITVVSGPTITTVSLPDGKKGVAYSQTLAATGGTSPYTFSVQTGTLPAGLSLSSAGVISGTPTAAVSSASITFKVNDSLGSTATKALSMTITGGGIHWWVWLIIGLVVLAVIAVVSVILVRRRRHSH